MKLTITNLKKVGYTDTLVEASSNKSLKIIDYIEFEKLLANSEINNLRFDKAQFEKHYDNKHKFYCLIEDNKLMAAASIFMNKLDLNDLYINEIQALQKGYGKKLIQELLKLKNIWLMAEPGNSILVDYYKQYNLKEFILNKNDSIYNVDTYYFYKDIDPLKFETAIKRSYSSN